MALDISTKTGWAYGRIPAAEPLALESAALKPKQPKSGVIYLPPGRNLGFCLSKFEDVLLCKINTFQPRGLIIEAPILPKGANRDVSLILMSLAGIAEKTAHECGIKWRKSVQPSDIKKHWTGRGNAKKADMMAKCDSLGWTYETDDEADALAIWSLGCAMLRKECRN